MLTWCSCAEGGWYSSFQSASTITRPTPQFASRMFVHYTRKMNRVDQLFDGSPVAHRDDPYRFFPGTWHFSPPSGVRCIMVSFSLVIFQSYQHVKRHQNKVHLEYNIVFYVQQQNSHSCSSRPQGPPVRNTITLELRLYSRAGPFFAGDNSRVQYHWIWMTE